MVLERQALGLLLLAVLAAYANSFGGDFQFDDYNVIVYSTLVQDWDRLAPTLLGGIRPLLKLSYWALWNVGDGTPWPFHLWNGLLHAANALMVFALGQKILGDARPALFGALLFAVHPVNTEAVTYLCGGSVAMAAFFQLAALLAWTNERRGLCLLLWLCALATRETAATLPLLLLLWEAHQGRGWALRRAWPFAALLLVAVLLVIPNSKYAHFFTVSLSARGLWDNALAQVHGLTWLLGQFFWPGRSNIDPDLPLSVAVDGLRLLEAALLMGLLGSALWLKRLWPWAAFCAAWGVLHFLPTNSLLPRLDVANERQWYLPGIALCWTLGYALHRLRGGAVITGLLVLILTAFTYQRNRDYTDELSLWAQTVRVSPGKARAWNNYGVALRITGDAEGAKAAFTRALALDPHHPEAQQNLELFAD